ncbi:hypothetical protein D3C85_1393900 [compost metagenome]
MVGVSMTEQHQVKLAHTQLAQAGQHHPLTQIEIAHGGARVIEHGVVTGAQNKSQPLADIELPNLDLPHRHALSRRKHYQQ